MSQKVKKTSDPEDVVARLAAVVYRPNVERELAVFYTLAADYQPPERMALFMLLAAGAADKVLHSERAGFGIFTSTKGFVEEFGFGFELTDTDYTKEELDAWFSLTAHDFGWTEGI